MLGKATAKEFAALAGALQEWLDIPATFAQQLVDTAALYQQAGHPNEAYGRMTRNAARCARSIRDHRVMKGIVPSLAVDRALARCEDAVQVYDGALRLLQERTDAD